MFDNKYKDLTGAFYRYNENNYYNKERCPDRDLKFLLLESIRFHNKGMCFDFWELFDWDGLDIFESYEEYLMIMS